MRSHREDDEWESNAPRTIYHYGNQHTANRILWWIMGIVSAAGLSEAAWLGSNVIDQKAEMAALKVEVSQLDRKVDEMMNEIRKRSP